MDQQTQLTDEHYMTREFLQNQIAALAEAIEKKDAMIVSLQDRSSEHSQTLFTERREHQAIMNSIKEYVIEATRSGEMNHEIAEALAEICDFELTKTVTINAVVEFEIELEVPFEVDADDVANGLEFSVDSFDYSIDDFNVDTRSLNAEDNIS
jgi:uncharacterized protein (DUF342 family)